MSHLHIIRIDTIEAIESGNPYSSLSVHDHLTDMQSGKGILALVREMIVGYYLTCKQGSLIHHKDTTLIGCHPQSALPILKNIISPGSRILARSVIDDEITHLSGAAIIKVNTMVGTNPDIPIIVFINLTHTVVAKRISLIVLLIPSHILISSIACRRFRLRIMNQAIGSTHPPFTITGPEHGMKTVTFARKGNLVERHIIIIGMGGETRKSVIGSNPDILPFIHEAGPYDVVRNGCFIARIVRIMGDGIVHRHHIESVISSNVKIAICFFCQTFHRVAIQSCNPGECLKIEISTIECTFCTNPVAMALGIVCQGIYQWLGTCRKRQQAVIQIQTIYLTLQQTF